jgi:bacillithiol synthase
MSTLLPVEAGQAGVDLAIQAGPLRGGARLVRDYLAAAPELRPFYGGHPSDPAAYERKAAEVAARLDPPARARLAPALEPLGDAPERLRRILDGDGFFVTTGQQPALFGGPLYTLYKTLAAIRLADALETQLGRPVLALFWIGADDHDWDEANHTSVLDAQGYVRTIRVRGDAAAPPLPLSDRAWGPGIGPAVDEFTRLLPDGERRDVLVRHIREAYTPDATVAGSFTETFRLLLRDQRIVLMSSAHPAVRWAASDVFRAEAERTAAHNGLVARQTRRLQAAGYDAQVVVAEEASNLMLLDAGGRDRLVRARNGWVSRRDRRTLSDRELLRRIDEAPEQFSPNVLLRPVVENAILPTIAYVAGPGELSYFAQIACLFQAHGIMPPVVVPRPAVALLEPPVQRVLRRLGLQPASFDAPFERVLADVVRAGLPAEVTGALERLRAAIRDGYAGLLEAATLVDPTLQGPLESARNASLLRATEAELRIGRQVKRRNTVLVEQVRRVSASLRPAGEAQERVLTPLPFAVRYGTGLVPAIAAALDMTPSGGVNWDGPVCDG